MVRTIVLATCLIGGVVSAHAQSAPTIIRDGQKATVTVTRPDGSSSTTTVTRNGNQTIIQTKQARSSPPAWDAGRR